MKRKKKERKESGQQKQTGITWDRRENRLQCFFRCQLVVIFLQRLFYQGIARTQSPTNTNYAPESPTFGVIAGVSQTGVQWKGLTLGEPPYWSRCPLCQVSMPEFTPATALERQTAAIFVVCSLAQRALCGGPLTSSWRVRPPLLGWAQCTQCMHIFIIKT